MADLLQHSCTDLVFSDKLAAVSFEAVLAAKRGVRCFSLVKQKQGFALVLSLRVGKDTAAPAIL